MEYPKPLMTIKEMVPLGFSREYLRRAAHSKNAHKFTDRTSGAPNATIRFDTAEFEKAGKRGELR